MVLPLKSQYSPHIISNLDMKQKIVICWLGSRTGRRSTGGTTAVLTEMEPVKAAVAVGTVSSEEEAAAAGVGAVTSDTDLPSNGPATAAANRLSSPAGLT